MRTRLALLAVLAALVVPAAAAAFDNAEPLAAKQWYLTEDRAWSYWPTQPQLYPVTVAVIDSGIDGTHPEFTGRVLAAKSFVLDAGCCPATPLHARMINASLGL